MSTEKELRIENDGRVYGPGTVSPSTSFHVRESVAEQLFSVPSISVKTDQDELVACDWLARIRLKRREIQSQFEAPIKGLRAEIAKLQTQRDDLLRPLAEAEARIESEIRAYRLRKAQEAAARQAKAEAAYEKKIERAISKGLDPVAVPPPPVIPAPTKTIKTETGKVTARKIRRFRIVDPDQVPDEYWVIDETKIGRAVRAGLEIPGVQTWEEEVLQVREVAL
jgi:hypothetical protein